MTFIQSYKSLLTFFLFIGVCPLSVNQSTDQVYMSKRSLLCTILNYLIQFTCLFPNAVQFNIGANVEDNNSTYNVSLLIESFSMIFFLILTLIFSIRFRSHQCYCLNKINRLSIKCKEQLNIDYGTREYRKIFPILIFGSIVYWLFLWYLFCSVQPNISEWNVILYYAVVCSHLIMLEHLVMHIRFIAAALNRMFYECIDPVNLATITKENSCRLIELLLNIQHVSVVELDKCFGVHMLLTFASDAILLSVGVFFDIYQIVYADKGKNNGVGSSVYYWIIYLLPMMLRKIWFVKTFEDIAKQVIIRE